MVRTNKEHSISDKDIRGAIRMLERANKTRNADCIFYFYTPYGIVRGDTSTKEVLGNEEAVKWFKELLITHSQNKV